MRHKLFYLLVITIFSCYKSLAQKAFIVTSSNTKIEVSEGSYELNSEYDKIQYLKVGDDNKTVIKLQEIQSAQLGEYQIQSFTIDNRSKAFFVIADSGDIKLVGYNKVKNTSTPSESSITTFYYYYILDKNENILQKISFDNSLISVSLIKREKALQQIKNYFSNCPEIAARIDQHQGNNRSNTLFDDPKYTNCTQTRTPALTTSTNAKPQSNPVSSDSNQGEIYSFGAISVPVKNRFKEYDATGKITIKDGFISIQTIDNTVKYKILKNKNGRVLCEDRDMKHTFEFYPETGKKKGFNYDTHIIFIADRKMGDSSMDYWSKKE